MAQILQSLYKTLFAGLVLLIVVLFVTTSVTGNPIQFSHAWGSFVMRWFRDYVDRLALVFQLCANSLHVQHSR